MLASIYETIDSLKITPKKINAARAELTDYINNRHNEYITEKLSINAAIKAKKRELDTLSQAYIDLGKDAPKEAKTLLKNQIEECRIIISDLQIDLKVIEEKIFDPDQVQEILEELTNQLNSLQFKIRTADAWQKDQIARNLFTNLEINNKNEVSYRCKRPLQGIIFSDSRHQIHFGARDWTRTSTSVKTLAPEASASTNSATRAIPRLYHASQNCLRIRRRSRCAPTVSETALILSEKTKIMLSR